MSPSEAGPDPERPRDDAGDEASGLRGAPPAQNAPTERSAGRNAAVLVILIGLLLASAGGLFWMLKAAKDRLDTGDYQGAGAAFEALEGGAAE